MSLAKTLLKTLCASVPALVLLTMAVLWRDSGDLIYAKQIQRGTTYGSRCAITVWYRNLKIREGCW